LNNATRQLGNSLNYLEIKFQISTLQIEATFFEKDWSI